MIQIIDPHKTRHLNTIQALRQVPKTNGAKKSQCHSWEHGYTGRSRMTNIFCSKWQAVTRAAVIGNRGGIVIKGWKSDHKSCIIICFTGSWERWNVGSPTEGLLLIQTILAGLAVPLWYYDESPLFTGQQLSVCRESDPRCHKGHLLEACKLVCYLCLGLHISQGGQCNQTLGSIVQGSKWCLYLTARVTWPLSRSLKWSSHCSNPSKWLLSLTHVREL